MLHERPRAFMEQADVKSPAVFRHAGLFFGISPAFAHAPHDFFLLGTSPSELVTKSPVFSNRASSMACREFMREGKSKWPMHQVPTTGSSTALIRRMTLPILMTSILKNRAMTGRRKNWRQIQEDSTLHRHRGHFRSSAVLPSSAGKAVKPTAPVPAPPVPTAWFSVINARRQVRTRRSNPCSRSRQNSAAPLFKP